MATQPGLNLNITTPADAAAAATEELGDREKLQDLIIKFDYLRDNMDVFFLINIGIIIFYMQCGFALLEAGSVRSKNTTNILIKNILDVFIGGLAYWIVGYPLAWGEGNFFLGYTGWVGIGVEHKALAKWFFQFVFAATATTIVSGSMAERCGFGAYLVYSFFLTGFVYPIVSHWCWTPDIGWLAIRGYQDFAGSGVVHLTGGTAAFVGCVIIGARHGRFGPTPRAIPGHSVPLAALGGFILLFGFLAFNGGSQAHISEKGDSASIAIAVVNTVLSACSAGITVMVTHACIEPCINSNHLHHWSFLLTLNGALTGMVAACAGCNDMPTWGGVATGVVAGLIYYMLHHLMIQMHVDDPLDAVAVHVGGGMWGLISVALFKHEGIVFQGENAVQTLLWNVAGMFAIIGWSGVLCTIMFSILKCLRLLRVSKETELRGLDIVKHGEPAYPADAWREEQYVESTKGDEQPRGLDLPLHMNTPWGYYSQPLMYQTPTSPMYGTLPDPRRYYQNKIGRYSVPMPRARRGPARPSEFYPQNNLPAVPPGDEHGERKEYCRLRIPKAHNGITNYAFRHDDETSGL